MEDKIEELESEINSLKSEISSARSLANFAIEMLVKVSEGENLDKVRETIRKQWG